MSFRGEIGYNDLSAESGGDRSMLNFILGLFVGGMVGVFVMCLLQINRNN